MKQFNKLSIFFKINVFSHQTLFSLVENEKM